MLKEKTAVKAGEIVDAAVMSRNALAAFVQAQIADAKAKGVLFSLHLKATMMKVSDPIMFGVVVEEFYKDVLAKHADVLKQAGFDPNNGIGDLYARLPQLPEATQKPSRPTRCRVRQAPGPPWSIPTRASPTCMCPATSSSMPRCRR